MKQLLSSLLWIGLVCAGIYAAGATADSETCSVEGLKPELFLNVKDLFKDELLRLRQLGDTRESPAETFHHLLEARPCQETGHYWILNENNQPVKVFGEMEKHCGSETGWLRVAHMNMKHPHSQCPGSLQEVSYPRRLCRRASQTGCSSSTFTVHGTNYSRVCGKVIAYQFGTPNAFGSGLEPAPRRRTLNDVYLDGVSITHGTPRQHIWSFAAALDEVPERQDTEYVCPCTNTTATYLGHIPSFVGSDYYCETGSRQRYAYQYYMDDPLWDGQGCGTASTCCDKPWAPYFCKELPETTTDDIELRLCMDQEQSNEDILLENIELYVQ